MNLEGAFYVAQGKWWNSSTDTPTNTPTEIHPVNQLILGKIS